MALLIEFDRDMAVVKPQYRYDLQNVVNCLVENFGIDRSRLAARGFGDTRRFAYNTGAEGRQENRRVNIITIINYPPGPRVSAQALDSNAP